MPHYIYKKTFLLVLFISSISLVYANAPADSILANLQKTHPRLIATSSDFSRIAKEKETDAYVKEAFQKIYKNGKDIINEPVSEFVIPDGLRLLEHRPKINLSAGSRRAASPVGCRDGHNRIHS